LLDATAEELAELSGLVEGSYAASPGRRCSVSLRRSRRRPRTLRSSTGSRGKSSKAPLEAISQRRSRRLLDRFLKAFQAAFDH